MVRGSAARLGDGVGDLGRPLHHRIADEDAAGALARLHRKQGRSTSVTVESFLAGCVGVVVPLDRVGFWFTFGMLTVG